ncbi:hypothetical protein C8R47DRAFT_720096 [Mycena vitilis]|nr:hypothetical protein C8R47DRAFT_720096 [Mycena vitilis]
MDLQICHQVSPLPAVVRVRESRLGRAGPWRCRARARSAHPRALSLPPTWSSSADGAATSVRPHAIAAVPVANGRSYLGLTFFEIAYRCRALQCHLGPRWSPSRGSREFDIDKFDGDGHVAAEAVYTPWILLREGLWRALPDSRSQVHPSGSRHCAGLPRSRSLQCFLLYGLRHPHSARSLGEESSEDFAQILRYLSRPDGSPTQSGFVLLRDTAYSACCINTS